MYTHMLFCMPSVPYCALSYLLQIERLNYWNTGLGYRNGFPEPSPTDMGLLDVTPCAVSAASAQTMNS